MTSRGWPASLLTILFTVAAARAQVPCEPPQRAFAPGEELRYDVNYNWGLVWLESATARFTVSNGTYQDRTVYHMRGEGSTHSGYDWFFRVRDLFESWVDTASLRPLKFTASMIEGGKSERHTYLFDDRKRRAYTVISKGKKLPVADTVQQAQCTIDVLTAIYYARCLDYSKCGVNDTIGMSLLIDGKVYPIYVRYLGRENYTSEKFGTYRCVKFSPLLVEGSIFKAGEGMKVWVSDDLNKLPLYIETPIVVGSIKVSLSGYGGLKYPEEARLR